MYSINLRVDENIDDDVDDSKYNVSKALVIKAIPTPNWQMKQKTVNT